MLKINMENKMRNILLVLTLVLGFSACSSKGDDSINVEPKIVVGKDLSSLSLNDQFEKPQRLNAETKMVIFAFSKDVAHTCNDFFETQTPTYLSENGALFVADVSAAPSLIRSLFIMPGLKDFKHTVLILDEKSVAAPYRNGVNVDKIVVAFVENGKITAIKTLTSDKELKELIEAK